MADAAGFDGQPHAALALYRAPSARAGGAAGSAGQGYPGDVRAIAPPLRGFRRKPDSTRARVFRANPRDYRSRRMAASTFARVYCQNLNAREFLRLSWRLGGLTSGRLALESETSEIQDWRTQNQCISIDLAVEVYP